MLRGKGCVNCWQAEQCKTTQLDEDGLLELIRTLPGKKSKYQEQAEQAARKVNWWGGKIDVWACKQTCIHDMHACTQHMYTPCMHTAPAHAHTTYTCTHHIHMHTSTHTPRLHACTHT